MPAPAPAPPSPTAVPPSSLVDDLLGSFWPDRAVPGRVSVLLGALGVGLLAAIVLPYRDAGIGTFLVLLAGGAVIMAASARGADRFTQACAVICVLLAGRHDAARRRLDHRAEHRHRRGRHRVRGDRRPHDAGLRALRDLRAARRPARSALARPHPGRADRRRQRGGPAPHRDLVGGRAAGLRAPLRLRRRAVRGVGGRAGPRPRAGVVRAPRVHRRGGGRRGAGGGVPRLSTRRGSTSRRRRSVR